MNSTINTTNNDILHNIYKTKSETKITQTPGSQRLTVRFIRE